MSYEVGKRYVFRHRRKGSFIGRVLFQDDVWVRVVIEGGTAKALLPENVKDKGDEVTLRKAFISGSVEQPE